MTAGTSAASRRDATTSRGSPTSARPRAGDACPECGGALTVQPAIEVGHIFKLGTFHSNALEATFLDEDGSEKPIVMGSYGIGPGAASWRPSSSSTTTSEGSSGRGPWRRTTCTSCACPGSRSRRKRSSSGWRPRAPSVLLDDRELRAGEKFADADLIGCPYRITVGKKTLEDGAVDVLVRQTGEERRVKLDEVEI